MPTQTQVRPPLTDTVQQFGAAPMAVVTSLQIQALAAAGTMLAEKDLLVADATAGTFIVTLPAVPYVGKPYTVKEISGANLVTVDAAGAGTIDGAATLAIPAREAATLVARVIDPVTGLVTWDAVSQTAPNPGAGGTLLAANNLSDVANAATARTNLGVPATGDVLLAANDLSDVADAALARSNIVANRKTIGFTRVDLIAANAAVYRYVNTSGFAQTILSIASAITGALAVGDATITASIGGVAVTDGAVTIAQAGSAAGDVDSTTPSALNVIGIGAVLELTVGGANTAAEFADVSVELSY